MKVFISWSGDVSYQVGKILHEWLPLPLPFVRPFLSSFDIHKGGRWSDRLSKELEDSQCGIICVTPANISVPWLNVEAGALSKSVKGSFLAPFLFNVSPEDLSGPLAQFQITVAERKDDVFKLVYSINSTVDEDIRILTSKIDEVFDAWWPRLHEQLSKIDYDRENVDTGFNWLFYSSHLTYYQKTTHCKEVWIIAAEDLDLTLNITCGADAFRHNVEHGVKYRFILPDEKQRETESEKIATKFASAGAHKSKDEINSSGIFEIKSIPKDEFAKSVVTSFLILNPNSDDDVYPLRVLVQTPTVAGGSHFWMKADDIAAHKFVERFKEKCAEKTSCPPP